MNTPMPSSRFTITAYVLRMLLMCERRVWLDHHGAPAMRGEIPPETLRLYARGLEHEQAVHAATSGMLEPIDVASWDEGVAVTRDLMRQGVPVILGACLEHRASLDLTGRVFTLRGQVDQLRRVFLNGEYIYCPVEIKQRSQSVVADWVQLDLYVWLLSRIQGITPPAELWLGADDDGRPRRRLLHEYDEERLLSAGTRVSWLLHDAPEPPVCIAAHCKECPWLTTCQNIARQEQSIDLLYGVSRKTREHMWQAGILTLSHLAALPPEVLQQVKGIGPVTAPAIRANAQAWIKGQPIRYNALPDVCRQPGWMFDLETLEVAGRTLPWCLGWCDPQGHTHIALVAPVRVPEALTLPDGQAVTLIPDSDAAWEVFASAVATRDGPIYHWTGFDAGILNATAPGEIRERLGPRMHDLHRSFTRTVSLPLGSTSIKPVSAYLGFPWTGYTDWFAAYLDYCQWLDTSSLDALTRACMYQRADVQSLAHVWRWLVNEA